MKTHHILTIILASVSPLSGYASSSPLNSDVDGKQAFINIQSKYNTHIPAEILTLPNENSRIGKLEFFDGLPTKNTVNRVYDNLDYIRGVETFLNGIPAASLHSIKVGQYSRGATQANQVLLYDSLLDSDPLMLTGNTSTVYASAFLDLKRDGATVVEIPPGVGPGTVNDAYFRFVTDMGAPGPDKGKGGKYLILPPDYKGDVPEGYFVSKSTSYVNWLILRGFLVNGKPNHSVKTFKNGLKIYPLKDANNPEEMEFISGSKKQFNTIHANNYKFYDELNEVIQYEPVSMLDPELRGLFASIGIEKGKPFNPTDEQKITLSEAVKVGNATARALAFDWRGSDARLYEERQWESGFIGGDYRWLKNEGKGGIYQDARSRFFYTATVNTPAMVWKMVGVGSQYGLAIRDGNGNYLDGSKTYKLHLPAGIPAKDFWSIVLYDPQTRSELQTSQPFPSISSQKGGLTYNEDGSIDLFFGPEPPKGKESNWRQTVSGKGWFSIIRMYGPLKPWFDKTWKPGDFELVD